eukprot:TRINITY_DN1493_c0_g1_i4.p1 TRINITY_DN1493_c0_g1~~TRINITY_DN1493_c0_g1_i4.p1  ORF type:complete len:517 (+),score=111.69 TRINITY_DN1493_c0_g1_i4:506-2056(+)
MSWVTARETWRAGPTVICRVSLVILPVSLACRPHRDMQGFPGDPTCQRIEARSCAEMVCEGNSRCVEDAHGAMCVPAETVRRLEDDEVCMRNGVIVGECKRGLVCRPRLDVQMFVAESVCQKFDGTNCAAILCTGDTMCVEDVRGARCVPTERPQLDCTWDAGTAAPWTREKKERCCAEQQVRCPIPMDETAKNDLAALEDKCHREGADLGECCSKIGVGCPAALFNCTEETPAPGKKEWCCAEEGKCGMDCSAVETLSSEERSTCCDLTGLGCNATSPVNAFKKYVLKLRAVPDVVLRSPKGFLKKLRMSLLRGSSLLAAHPEWLVVTQVGVLMANFTLPPSGRAGWAVDVSLSWNTALMPTEKDVLGHLGGTVGKGDVMKTLEGLATDDGVFGVYYIAADGEDAQQKVVEEIANATAEAAKGEGAMRDNTGGRSFVVSPVLNAAATATDDGSSSSGDSSSSNSLLYGIIAAAGAVCMVSALAIAAFRRSRRKDSTVDHQHFHTPLKLPEEETEI